MDPDDRSRQVREVKIMAAGVTVGVVIGIGLALGDAAERAGQAAGRAVTNSTLSGPRTPELVRLHGDVAGASAGKVASEGIKCTIL